MLLRRAIGALLVGLFPTVTLLPTVAHAREAGPRVLVRFGPQVARGDAARLVSAIRAQLGETATIVVDPATTSPVCVVDVDRSGPAIVLHLTDGRGRVAGPPRRIAHGGELGASEAATIVRAFVLAATQAAPEARPGDETERETAHEDDGPPDARATSANSIEPSAPGTASAPARAPSQSRLRSSPFDERDAAADTPPAIWHARVAALYTGATYASELAWQSGARLEGVYAFFPGIYGGLTYALHPTAELATETASVRVSRQSGALFVGVESSRRAWGLGADVSAGVEGTTMSTKPAAVLRGAGGAAPAPVFAVRLHGRWRVPDGHGLALDVAPALELAPGRSRLVVESSDSATQLTVVAARFRLDVGGTFDLF